MGEQARGGERHVCSWWWKGAADCSARGDIVLDSFLGSGTTVIAAERTGRRCYGMELDPAYVDTAIRRWQVLTGESALHAASGRSFADLSREAEVADVA